MNFAFSEEQEAFRETLRRFLEARSPTAEVFRLTETPEGFDPAVWKQMACELGLQGVQIPESYGGQGFGFLELGIVFEEMGRVLLCSPYFSTVCLGANAILNAGSEKQKAALLPGISKGETVATLALVDESGSWNPASVDLELRRDGDDWILDGVKRLVTDGALADRLTRSTSSSLASGRAKRMFSAIVPSKRKFSCNTTPRCCRKSFNLIPSMFLPSTVICPLSGRLKAITRLTKVLFPEPLEPTSAVVVPAAAKNEMPLITGTSLS